MLKRADPAHKRDYKMLKISSKTSPELKKSESELSMGKGEICCGKERFQAAVRRRRAYATVAVTQLLTYE